MPSRKQRRRRAKERRHEDEYGSARGAGEAAARKPCAGLSAPAQGGRWPEKVPGAGRGGKQGETPAPALGGARPPFVGLENAGGPGARLDRFTAGLDPRQAVDDQHEGMLLDLMVAERLTGLEHDEHSARGLVGVEHDG